MERLRLLAFALLSACLALAAGNEVAAATLISIDKPSQTMTVSVNGEVQYRWRVSTGASGFSTPTGTYTPFRMEVMHYSQEWDNAGMPHTIFFTSRGHGIHGSDHPGLGTPRSHGCVRLTLTNAATLYQLVQAQGMGNTKVVVMGADPPGRWEASVSPQARPAGRGRGQLFPFGIFGGSR